MRGPVTGLMINTLKKKKKRKKKVASRGLTGRLTRSPGGGDLHGAKVVRRLVCGSSYEVVVEAIVAELEQLHEEAVLGLIVQVEVLPRRLRRART